MHSSLRALAGIALMVVSACSSAAQSMKQPLPTDVVATVDQTSITLAEVDERALAQPVGNFSALRLVDALYEARRGAIDDMINSRLLDRAARAEGIAMSDLLQRELTGRVVPPTDLDIAAWYKANPTRVQGAPIEEVREPIKNLLQGERANAARREYLDTLRAKAAISVRLDAPRVKIADAGKPSRGPENAPVEIVEFSDFQCPFCLSAFPTVTKVLATYGDKIRFVYRHYPLPNHPNARPAAEASACADEQGKFWPYHDRLFASAGKISEADLKEHATAIGLDAASFNTCVSSRKYQKDVESDIDAANELGVNGTPAFFINGRALNGAQPFEAFKRIIDEELKSK
jgi:protein-disulfide isomerase